MRLSSRLLAVGSSLVLLAVAPLGRGTTVESALTWPSETREARPWAYWWWMGSAVDRTNLTRELTRYAAAGYGGVHIIPIYGAKGWETNYISYLSPRWMEMLGYTVSEARRLGMDVDMTTGSGWCFGGPRVTDDEANASVVTRTFTVSSGQRLTNNFDRQATQALVAYGPHGAITDLTRRIAANGAVDWLAPAGDWGVWTVSQKPAGQKVKRAGPGGTGHMLNLIYPQAVQHFTSWFEEAFARYRGPKPRAQYHDSYEYRSEWAPDFLARFEQRRGYRLQTELPALFGGGDAASPTVPTGASPPPAERTARVLCDYRETVSDIMSEDALPVWAKWSRSRGFLTRNEAHGSPGNLLDLYALADIPETEMFHSDRNKLISKFASSAAHVAGHKLTSAETGTWLEEHFTETLADMKYLLDDLFLSGVNHVFYHGTCYSPDEAGWPGWLFYASYEMNPRNSIWRDVPALNAYVTRCQSVLQSGKSDNDILLYWPIHDFWSQPGNKLLPHLTVHARDWFEAQPLGRLAEQLWQRGYAFDYASDRQLTAARSASGGIQVAGGIYRTVLVPACEKMPVATLRKLVALADSGATVIFQKQLPQDVPGLGDLETRRKQLAEIKRRIPVAGGAVGKGRVLIGDAQRALGTAGIARESLFDHPGLMCIRRTTGTGRTYFLANRGDQAVQGWVPLATAASSVVAMDALSGKTGVALTRSGSSGGTEVYLELPSGGSLVLRALADQIVGGPAWSNWRAAGGPTSIAGPWRVEFLAGGPKLPATAAVGRLSSWTTIGGGDAEHFAGTARYRVTFDAPGTASHWRLDLGKVCQSARVRLNGRELGTLITAPFSIVLDQLQPRGNVLEVEVTSVSANAIRYYDRAKVPWKNFHDINFVNLNYRPFDASDWPVTDAGLLGPVTLTPLSALNPSGGGR